MNSFDVFDTLIARRYVNSYVIWEAIESEFKIASFVKARIAADTGSRSFDEIYAVLVNTGVITSKLKAVMMAREIELEIENCYPVQVNMDRVQHGDVLISDMYLPANVIMQMVRAAGLTKQVTIFQSNAGKSNGSIWDTLKANPPVLHLGDNKHSDYDMPMSRGIKGEWFPGTAPSSTEEFFLNNHMLETAMLTREIRLTDNSSVYKNFFDIAAGLNLPWLLTVCEMLHRKYDDTHLVFLGRDCQLMHKVYNAYYGVADYLPMSRHIAYAQPVETMQYISANVPAGAVCVDVLSTGGTWEHLDKFGKVNVCVAVYSDESFYNKTKPVLPSTFTYLTQNSKIGKTNIVLELFNCGDHGYIESLHLTGKVISAKFAVHENNAQLVTAIHGPVTESVALAAIYQLPIREELSKLSDEQLLDTYIKITAAICNQLPVMQQQLPEFFAKEETYLHKFVNKMNTTPAVNKLTLLANKFNSDKGSTYKCAHGYTEHYAKIFAPYVDANFTMLEIGLNRDNQESIPSMSIYEEYFSNATLYGFDIHPGFAKFNNPAKNRFIIIGDQAKPAELNQLGDKQFDIIIDDGYHASKHQQITLKTLWKNLKSGGIFVVEDLHYQPEAQIETSTKTKDLLRAWAKGDVATSDWITLSEAQSVINGIAKIELFDSKSTNWDNIAVKDAFAIIYKK